MQKLLLQAIIPQLIAVQHLHLQTQYGLCSKQPGVQNQKLYWHSIAYLMGIVTIQHSTLGIFCMLYTLRVQKHMILKWDQSN